MYVTTVSLVLGISTYQVLIDTIHTLIFWAISQRPGIIDSYENMRIVVMSVIC